MSNCTGRQSRPGAADADPCPRILWPAVRLGCGAARRGRGRDCAQDLRAPVGDLCTQDGPGAIDLLELEGPALGRPTVDKVNGSKFHKMKELRPAGRSIRVLFIFDPRRQAILLLGGDKSGNWKSWFPKSVPSRHENGPGVSSEGRFTW